MKVHEDIYVAYIPTLAVAVLPYNTMIYYPKLKSNTFTMVERLDTTLQVHNFIWGCLQDRCSNDVDTGNQNKTSGWNTLIF